MKWFVDYGIALLAIVISLASIGISVYGNIVFNRRYTELTSSPRSGPINISEPGRKIEIQTGK